LICIKNSKQEDCEISTQSKWYHPCLNKTIVPEHAVTMHEPLPDKVASGSRLHEIIAKLRKAAKIEIATGYQDETGFHPGVKPAEKEIKWPPDW
jgi:hypothetical protein